MSIDDKAVEETSFGEWLRQRRRMLDLTQQALADQVGCARITLRRIESGALKPSKELASILLEKLGIPETEWPQWISFARGISSFPSQSIPISNKTITNLPAPLTTFIGREKEQSEIIGLLTKYRLVMLTGSGGVGKTRLSIKVGEQVLRNYPDGVWLVELASLGDPALLPQTVAALFGIMMQSHTPFMDLLINFFREKSALLILDNCEHLLDACARFSDTLLKSCSQLKILATSREPLGIAGEAIYWLSPLEIPDPQQLIDSFRDFESVHLFEERAKLAQFDFSLMLENASSVVQICQRLDGIPLAIELAAAKVGLMSTKQIAKQLNESFNLLRGGSRTDLPHHQTLRASMSWSWGLLTEPEQTLMQQLSVFAGGWTLEASQSVCYGDVLELTNSLVKKSLIVINQEVGHETRYRFHETIRQYAQEKLLESSEDKQVRSRHLDYFLKLAQKAEPELYGARQIEWSQKLEDEHENLRAAFEWSLQGDVTSGQYLAGALWWWWHLQGYYDEGYGWLKKMLDASPENESVIQAKLLSGAGFLADDLETVKGLSEKSVSLFRKLGAEAGSALPLFALSTVYGYSNFDLATQLLTESLDLFKRAGNKWGIVQVLGYWGYITHVHGNFAEASRILNEALLIANELKNKELIANVLFRKGGLAKAQMDDTRAMELFEAALQLAQELKNKAFTAMILRDMGSVSIRQRDYDRGIICLEQMREIYQKIGQRSGMAESLRQLGWAARLQGDYAKARSFFAESLPLMVPYVGQEAYMAECLIDIGKLMGAQGSPEKFARLLGMAEGAAPEIHKLMSPYFRAETEKFIENARAALGEAAFSNEYEDGKKMTLDEAIAYALKEI